MGGIVGIHAPGGVVTPEERAALGVGASFAEGGSALVARHRSTLARDDRYTVLVSGHFDRAPASGLGAADVLLDEWTRYGVEALGRVDGAWVAAVLDRQDRRLWLARDAFGVRRIYAWRNGGRLAFASQLPWLLGIPGVPRALSRENLAEFLAFRYVHSPRTLLRDVVSVPPGHWLRFDGELVIEPYARLRYSPPFADLPPDEPTLAELERRLNRAVAARASGRERVGVFLSGGLDSSAITLYASKLGPVHTFTVAVEGDDGDETAYAGRVANLLHANHEVLRVDAASFGDALETMIGAGDQPLTDPAAVPQYLLARAARPHVDVILSGDGGDEVFGGRMVAALAGEVRVSAGLRRLPAPAVHLAGRLLGPRRPELTEDGVPFGLARLVGGFQVFDLDARTALLRDPGMVRAGIRRATLEPLYRQVTSDPINEILHVYLRGRMVEDALFRSGLATRLADVGLREPLLDRDLVAWCATLPGPWKVRWKPTGAVSKWPLRSLLQPVLGRPLVNRPKRVLPGPWRRWIVGGSARFLDARIAALREDRAQLFLPGAIDALASNADAPGAAGRLWLLLFLDGWMRALDITG